MKASPLLFLSLLLSSPLALAADGQLSAFQCFGTELMKSVGNPAHTLMLNEAYFAPQKGMFGDMVVLNFSAEFIKSGEPIAMQVPVTKNVQYTVNFTQKESTLEANGPSAHKSNSYYSFRFHDLKYGKGKVSIGFGFDQFEGEVTCPELE